MITLKDADELTDFLMGTEFLVVDFYTDTCMPCKLLAPVFEQVATKFPKATFVKYNASNHEGLEEFNIMAVPTIIVFHDGGEESRIVGLKPQATLEKTIKDVLDSRHEPI